MALPVWAHRRAVLYDSVVMDDGRDDDLASHQEVSSPESFFCRPMMPTEILDAVTCASGNFRSAKGIFDHTVDRSYYPPRDDLVDWGNICVPKISGGSACNYGDARQFGLINDLDTIATATPPYDRTFNATWNIPSAIPDGDYSLMVEVGKEFDTNASFSHTSFLTSYEAEFYGQYGLDGNVGQPSVVYRLGFHVSSDLIPPAATTTPVGYGDWTGVSGDLIPFDARIDDGSGSGGGRLRITDGAGGSGRIHLAGLPCAPLDCSVSSPPESPRMDEPTGNQDPPSVTFTFRQASDSDAPVIAYEMKYERYNQAQLDETNLDGWIPAPSPAVGPPGTITTVTLRGLAPQSGYAVALRARGVCGWSTPGFIRFYVGPTKYAKLSGCVIATAAYGSNLHPDVTFLRRERDWAVAHWGIAKLGALLYAESAPPLAALIGRSDTTRAAVRSVLRPIIDANRAAVVSLPTP